VTETEGEADAWTPHNFRVTLDITSPTGEKTREELDPDTDAVFLTLAAIDKFVIPYYTGLYGVERAAEIRRIYCAHPEKWVHVLESAWTPRGPKEIDPTGGNVA